MAKLYIHTYIHSRYTERTSRGGLQSKAPKMVCVIEIS